MSSAIVPAINSKVYSGFSPTQIPGCELWLDGADASSLTLSGSNVTQWRDKSVRSNTITTSGTPTFSASNLGIGAVSFNGTNAYFVNTTLPITLTQYSLFFVCQQTSYVINNLGIVVLTNGTSVDYASSNTFIYASSNSASNIYLEMGSAGGFYRPTPYSLTPFSIYSDVTTGTSKSFHRNGNLLTTQTFTGLTSSVGFLIGGRKEQGTNTISRFFSGFIGEVLIFNTTLSTGQRQQIEGYLAHKWGLTTNLPVTHPFKRIPPVSRPFAPIDIPACQLWLDAADLSSITLSGSTVSQWNDKSGNARHATQPTTARQPTYSNNEVQFVGSSQNFMTLPNGSIWSPANSSVSIFIVMAPTSNYNVNVFLFQGTVSPAAGFGMYGNGTSFQDYLQDVGSTAWGSYVVGTTYMLGYFYTQNTNIFQSTNGTYALLRNQGAYSTALTNATIGAESPTQGRNFYSFSNFRELIIYNTTLTNAQRQQIEGYLAWKWGLNANIPSTHAFKLYPPLTTMFTPHEVATCAVWLDAADTTTIAGIPDVTSWTNKGTLGGTAGTPTDGTRVSGNIVNGLNYIAFSALSRLSINVNLNTQERSYFIVSRKAPPLNGNATFFSTSSSTAGYAFCGSGYVNTTTSDLQLGRVGSTRVAANIPTATMNTIYMASLINSATTSLNVLTLNGTPQTLKTSLNASGYLAGGVYTISRSTHGAVDIMEIIIYHGYLNPSQRQRVEGYLAWKWRLLNTLPATHPYYKFRP